MKRKKLLKTIFFIIIAILFLTVFYNLFSYCTKGKLKVNVTMSNTSYIGSNVDILVDVSKKETGKTGNSKVKLELYDNEGKKIKKTKTCAKIEKNSKESISLELPQNLEPGKYNLKVTASLGIFKDSFDLPLNLLDGQNERIIISLDKGIYKPGDQINYRALILSDKDYKPEDNKEYSVFIYDGNENRVYAETTNSSEYGIISGSFKLANEVNSGTYKITISNKSQKFSKIFTVNPYITPKFEAEILTDKEKYIVGETAQITISGKYFFGEPVVQASVKGKINNEEILGITNNEGNFVISYPIEKKGKLNLKFEITDTSNYVVETQKKVMCGTDIFEIEILPEYENIISGIDNTIYIVTKTISGEPIKTYSDISISKINKQVITDDNGIGSFILTSDDIDSLKSSSTINVDCKDMNNNEIIKKQNISVLSNEGTLVRTDKIKYQAGDDINVSLKSNNNLNNNVIFVCKNNELLKIFSSNNNEITFNLEDVTGLIDIYTPSTLEREYNSQQYKFGYEKSYNISDYNKKTIFIKPDKSLNINISTDSEIYKPGDNLNIEFTTTDEKNQSVDSALLVSILDEAILNLAENDLSIDNIKLALQDVELTEEMTAADLYANVLDDSSDITLNTVLLRQSFKEPNIVSESYENYETGEYFSRAIIIGLIAIIIIAVYILLKTKHAKNIMIVLVDIFGITAIILSYVEDFFVYTIGSYIVGLATALVISIVIYILILYNEKDYIFKLLFEFIIIPLIMNVVIEMLYEILPYSAYEIILYAIIIFMLIVLIIFAITKAKSRKKKLGKFENILHKSTKIIIKATLFWIITIMVYEVLGKIAFLITLTVYIIFDRIILKQKKEKPIQDGKIVLEITGMDIISVFIGIAMIIFIIWFFSCEHMTFGQEIVDSMGTMDITDSEITFKDIDTQYFIAEDTTGNASNQSLEKPFTSSQSNSDIKNSIESLFKSDKETDKLESNEDSLENETFDSAEENNQIEESVRNVFLESLAFIPELVTENGKAEANLKISDNITTWNIQTVGNTKEGNIGYSEKTFKVFKEFFVDFSVPNNCVVADKISIPVTLYNYTENDLNIDVNVVENEWSNIGNYTKNVTVGAKLTSMIYVPIEIIKQGENILRIETNAGNVSDIVEKNISVKLNGLQKQEVSSSGIIENKYEQDMIFDNETLDGSKKVKIKLYATPISQTVEGIENILKMPTGCFEQTSSSLYPDILVLKYLKANEMSDEKIEEKALEYISAGYQKLLTYEVPDEKGGYSLYGNSPAEPVITAFGLMEFKELSEIYDVDENVINNMTEYLFKNQKSNGSFKYNSTYIGNASSVDDYAMNAYIVWALSEVCPEDSRLEKSLNYFEKNLNKITDNYTLALIANIFANTNKESEAKEVIEEITNDLKINGEIGYLKSDICDYYGTSGKYQDIQATALTSMALSKLDKDRKNNELMINYLINSKNSHGTWYTTQATILSLKAINMYSSGSNISNQTITVRFNDKEEKIDIDKNSLDYYEFEFDNVSTENKYSIDMKKGKITYEVIKEYYEDYSKLENTSDISLSQTIDTNVKVNDIITQKITISNNNKKIANGLIEIDIPQGATPIEESLLKLKHDKIIEKYEYNYGKINIYLRNFNKNNTLNFKIQYKALYPVEITGASIRFFDYYNPNVECISLPVKINVTQ